MKIETPMKPDDYQFYLTNVTLDAWDLSSPLIKVYCIRSVFSGWFGFGRHLGYKAVVTDGCRWGEGEAQDTPSRAVRSAVEKLMSFDKPGPIAHTDTRKGIFTAASPRGNH